MDAGPTQLLHQSLRAALLVTAAIALSGWEATPSAETDCEAAARRFAQQILDTRASKPRLPLSSDDEHARSIDPVLSRGAPVWIHENLPSPPLTVMAGRVFSYSDLIYDPLDAPLLKIRPIDDDQVIPFLVRVIVEAAGKMHRSSAVNVRFPVPLVFDPRLAGVEAWVDNVATAVEIERSLDEAILDVRVPLARSSAEPGTDTGATTTVMVRGELVFGPYRVISSGRYGEIAGARDASSVAGLARLEEGRDFSSPGERDRLRTIAATVVADASSPYGRVFAVNSWVGDRLRYEEGPATRSAIEALEDEHGDCDEHTTLAAALLRAIGIPARRTTGFLYNFDTLSTHVWLEVALPTRDGDLSWFIADPTFAGTGQRDADKAAYVQFKNRILLYPIKPTVRVEGFSGRRTVDVLFNWRASGSRPLLDAAAADRFIDLTTSTIDSEFLRCAEHLASARLLLPRKSASVVGSPYLIVDRPLQPASSSRIQLLLENEERLALELATSTASKLDAEAVTRLRALYEDLNRMFFAGLPAHHNLELLFERDRHTDRLEAVTLRCGGYLVEHFLERILKRLVKEELVTEEEIATLTAVAEASGGRNLYLLQELAYRLPAEVHGGDPLAGFENVEDAE